MPSQGPSRRRGSRSHEERPAPVLRRSTLVITNIAKIVGLGIAINEMVIRPNLRESVVAFCAICILGTQVVEDVVLHAIDRIFSRESE